jgi:hypothetical protein
MEADINDEFFRLYLSRAVLKLLLQQHKFDVIVCM